MSSATYVPSTIPRPSAGADVAFMLIPAVLTAVGWQRYILQGFTDAMNNDALGAYMKVTAFCLLTLIAGIIAAIVIPPAEWLLLRDAYESTPFALLFCGLAVALTTFCAFVAASLGHGLDAVDGVRALVSEAYLPTDWTEVVVGTLFFTLLFGVAPALCWLLHLRSHRSASTTY